MSNLPVLYGITTCDTVRKARRWLEVHAMAFRYHDLRKDGVTHAMIADWIDQVGWEKLLNRSGTTFRKLAEKDRQISGEADAIALMLAFPATIRRPVFEYEGGLQIGFSPEIYQAFLSLSV